MSKASILGHKEKALRIKSVHKNMEVKSWGSY